MRLESPCQPSRIRVTSILTMSPSRSGLSFGMPWQTTWLIEVQIDFGVAAVEQRSPGRRRDPCAKSKTSLSRCVGRDARAGRARPAGRAPRPSAARRGAWPRRPPGRGAAPRGRACARECRVSVIEVSCSAAECRDRRGRRKRMRRGPACGPGAAMRMSSAVERRARPLRRPQGPATRHDRSPPLRRLRARPASSAGRSSAPAPCRTAGRRRRLAFLLRRLAIRRLRGAPVDVEALGARMRLYPYNNVCEKRVLFTPAVLRPAGARDPRSRHPRRLHLRRHRGEYRRLLAVRRRAGRASARILAVEPQPDDLRPPRPTTSARTRSGPSRRSPARSPTRPAS